MGQTSCVLLGFAKRLLEIKAKNNVVTTIRTTFQHFEFRLDRGTMIVSITVFIRLSAQPRIIIYTVIVIEC